MMQRAACALPRSALLRGGLGGCAASRLFHGQHQATANTARPPSASSDFHELRERSLLRHIISSSTEGDADSVIYAMDQFWDTYYNGSGTKEWNLRGSALDEAITRSQPEFCMELGTYCGYTAVRMGRLLPPGAKLVSIEIEPLYAAIASKVVEHAGLRDVVSVEIGALSERLPAVRRKHGDGPLGVLVLDHKVSEFLGDVQLLERHGMINKSTAVLCDWNLYPGSDEQEQAPSAGTEFMEYLKTREAGDAPVTQRHMLGDKDVFTVSTWSGFTV